MGAYRSGVSFCVDKWVSWPDGLEDTVFSDALDAHSVNEATSATDLSFVDPMLRRRLGRLSRMALHVAHKADVDFSAGSAVFASRHGELGRSVDILNQLAQGDMPSPAAFSLSVHNATAGVYSIASNTTIPSTTIAAGEETLLWALCEACLRLKEHESVLVVYADEPLPSEYASFSDTNESAHAIAIRIKRGDAFRLSWQASSSQTIGTLPLSLAILSWVSHPAEGFSWNGHRLSIQGNGSASAH